MSDTPRTDAERVSELLVRYANGFIRCDGEDTKAEAELLSFFSDGAKWVSTEQRKPEDGQTVLAYWATVGHCPASYESLTYHASDAPDSRECWSDVFGSDDDEPTHWMPLPEAPK